MRRSIICLVIACVAAVATGCREPLREAEQPRLLEVPTYLTDTVGQRAVFSGADYIEVYGIGLVTGLAGTGAGVYPPGLREMMVKEISRRRVPNPEEVLADKNNAVVYVSGLIPPGSRPGEKFDLVVTAAPGTQTTSLEGGALLALELARAGLIRTGTAAAGPVLADGKGPLFVSPFTVESRPGSGEARPIGPAGSGEAAAVRQLDPRIATVLGGGRCRHARGFFLNLLEPSERTAEQMVRHINARFPASSEGKLDPGIITLRVPAAYQEDKQRFLDVVGAIYLSDSPELRDTRMRALVSELEGGRDLRRVTAGLEAFGQPVVRLLMPLTSDPRPAVSFHAGQVLARLGRPEAVVTLEKFVRDDSSPYQEAAVRAVGELPGGVNVGLLREALSAKSPTVRIAAYLALLRIAPATLEARQIPHKLEVGLVETEAEPFVYVGRQLEPRVVIFGEVRIRPPLLVDTPRLLASVGVGGERLAMMNKWYGPASKVETGLDVGWVVAGLAGPLPGAGEDPKPTSLDLSYSDVVGFLDQASKSGALAAPVVYEPVKVFGLPVTPPTGPGGRETDIVLPPK